MHDIPPASVRRESAAQAPRHAFVEVETGPPLAAARPAAARLIQAIRPSGFMEAMAAAAETQELRLVRTDVRHADSLVDGHQEPLKKNAALHIRAAQTGDAVQDFGVLHIERLLAQTTVPSPRPVGGVITTHS